MGQNKKIKLTKWSKKFKLKIQYDKNDQNKQFKTIKKWKEMSKKIQNDKRIIKTNSSKWSKQTIKNDQKLWKKFKMTKKI